MAKKELLARKLRDTETSCDIVNKLVLRHFRIAYVILSSNNHEGTEVQYTTRCATPLFMTTAFVESKKH